MDIILWPFKLVFRLIAVIIGLAIMLIGGVLCITIIGSVIGVPLTLFGFALMVRGFF